MSLNFGTPTFGHLSDKDENLLENCLIFITNQVKVVAKSNKESSPKAVEEKDMST